MINLPDLPYDKNALEPYISKQTLDFHYSKHHQTYINNLNKFIKGTELEHKSLEEIIKISAFDNSKISIFNNAAQTWNHNLYWNCMKNNGGNRPSGKLASMIERDFKNFDNFIKEFKLKASSHFGSGWSWLIKNNKGELEIINTINADLPLAHSLTALMGIDIWEHAYYLDYQNNRPDYISAFLEKLVNWNFVSSNI